MNEIKQHLCHKNNVLSNSPHWRYRAGIETAVCWAAFLSEEAFWSLFPESPGSFWLQIRSWQQTKTVFGVKDVSLIINRRYCSASSRFPLAKLCCCPGDSFLSHNPLLCGFCACAEPRRSSRAAGVHDNNKQQ